MSRGFVVLLRGINVGGHKKLPMADLREVLTKAGHTNVRTVLQSGNVRIESELDSGPLASAIAQTIEQRFGFEVNVIVRLAEQWSTYAAGGAFPEAESERPNLVHLALASEPPPASAVSMLQEYGKNGEVVRAVDDGIWIDYPNGSGRSKITPKVLDRAFGAPVTCRNFKTVARIEQL